MMSRLKPMLSLLLALVVCGVSSQAAVCELSCGLDAQGVACRMATAPQHAEMQGMPHGHCAPESATRMVPNAGMDASISSVYKTGCGHALSPAVENFVAAKARFASSQPAFFQSASGDIVIPLSSAFTEKRPPPRSLAAVSLLVTLRI